MGSAFSGGVGMVGILGCVSGLRIPHPSRDIAIHKSEVLATIKRIYVLV